MDTSFIYAAEWKEIAQKRKTMVVTRHKIKYRDEAVRKNDIGYKGRARGRRKALTPGAQM
jgi:hypothetical protein